MAGAAGSQRYYPAERRCAAEGKIDRPPAQNIWNEMHFLREFPLAHYEMSFLLPHFLKEGRGKIDVYFTRVFNPVWTYPDGFSWVEALRDEAKIGLHIALTPTWNETAYWADLVLPTFRLPTLIHTRSGAAKWLNEIAQCNPLWLHPTDGHRLSLADGELVRVRTEIGYFVDRVWLTEANRPGVAACSHHLGRWRRSQDVPANRYSANVVTVAQTEPGKWLVRQVEGPGPFPSADPDSARVWWREGGVPQNLTFPVQPDPISGMHCWHQRVTIRKAEPQDRYGDVFVDTQLSHEVYKRWLAKARAKLGPGGLRRPLWLNRPLRPALDAFYVQGSPGSSSRDSTLSEETWCYAI